MRTFLDRLPHIAAGAVALVTFLMLAEGGTKTCMPSEMSLGVPETKTVFANYLRSHPDVGNSFGNNSADLVAAMAVVGAYKCGPNYALN